MRPVLQLRTKVAPPAAPALPLAALRLRRSLAWPVGQAEAELSPAADAPKAGDEILIEGGLQGESLSPVFTGRVLHHQQGLWSTRLVAEEPAGSLARLHLARAIKSGTAAQTIADLCQEASVSCMAEPPGALLPSYALLDNQSALDHIMRLARMSGMYCRTDTGGRLRVETALPAPNGTVLQPSGPVLDLTVYEDPDEPVAPKVAGEGAMGAKGPGAEAWVLQSADDMSAGDGPAILLMPGIKTKADATRVATAESMAAKESRTRLSLTMAGMPAGDLGEVIMLLNFSAFTGPARITGIELLWSATTGLITTLDLNGLGG